MSLASDAQTRAGRSDPTTPVAQTLAVRETWTRSSNSDPHLHGPPAQTLAVRSKRGRFRAQALAARVLSAVLHGASVEPRLVTPPRHESVAMTSSSSRTLTLLLRRCFTEA